MTQTNDPPTVLDIGLIPNSNEKADLNAPSDSGGKLLTNQAPNITITETAVVADAEERLALDVQEGDIAIQTNVSSSFIFTGGDNVANNWQTIDFDAVGAIDGETISPANLNISGSINGADASAAVAGEALTSDGSGSLAFASLGGTEPLTLTENELDNFFNDASKVQDLFTKPIILSIVLNSAVAMEGLANSQTGMDEAATSETAMAQIGNSQPAQNAILDSNTALTSLDDAATSFTFSDGEIYNANARFVIPETDENYNVYIKEANYTGATNTTCTFDFGWYDGDDNYLGENISNIFVDQLKIGWTTKNQCGPGDKPVSGDIEAVIF